MNRPLFLNNEKLFCNKCNVYINKFIDTIAVNEQVHCLNCQNWLCSTYDAFGNITAPRQDGLKRKEEFIKQFLKVVEKKLLENLPDEDFEDVMIEKAWLIVGGEARHIVNRIR